MRDNCFLNIKQDDLEPEVESKFNTIQEARFSLRYMHYYPSSHLYDSALSVGFWTARRSHSPPKLEQRPVAAPILTSDIIMMTLCIALQQDRCVAK